MNVAERPRNNLERNLWRGTGVVLALEAIKLIATLPLPKTENQALEIMGVGLFTPFWLMWGEGRGNWFKEDLDNSMSLLQEAAIFVGDHITTPLRKKFYELDNPGKKAVIKRVEYHGPSIFAGEETTPWHGPILKAGQKKVEWHIGQNMVMPNGSTLFISYDNNND